MLDYKDPINENGSNGFETFVLNRLLVDPKATFDNLLGKPDLESRLWPSYRGELGRSRKLRVREHIPVHHHLPRRGDRRNAGNTATVVNVPVTVGQAASAKVTKSFKIKGTGIETEVSSTSVTADELKAGRIKAMEISLTVLSDAGVDLIRRTALTTRRKADFMAKNSYQYSKLVQLPSM